jgi:hypothetical protein
MKKSLSPKVNMWMARAGQLMRPVLYAVRSYSSEISEKMPPVLPRVRLDIAAVISFVRRRYTRRLPELAVSAAHPSTLLILMGGTTIDEYDAAGQLGRLSSALERYARHFRTVLLMTADRKDFTKQLDVPRVRHLKTPVVVPFRGSLTLVASVVMRFRSVRHASVVTVMDTQGATAGWLASQVSNSALTFSVGTPWSHPREQSEEWHAGKMQRKALDHVRLSVGWPRVTDTHLDSLPEPYRLPALVDVDLYCPLTTTDPARPRTVGVFLGSNHDSGGRMIIGVAEHLLKRRQALVLRVFVATSHGGNEKAAALQAEAMQRGVNVEFLALPAPEMLPDAIERMRLCVGFNDPVSSQLLLRAMSSGISCISIEPDATVTSGDADGVDWSEFVLQSAATQEDVARNIETLFREPAVRLRLAREGRRFVVSRHSFDALVALEAKLLLRTSANYVEDTVIDTEPEFNAEDEAAKLAMMLESVGVARAGTSVAA